MLIVQLIMQQNRQFISIYCFSQEQSEREPKFLSTITKLMDSLLPSFKEQLPKPQLFVELKKSNPNSVRNTQRKRNNFESETKDSNSYVKNRKAFLPTRIPPVYEESEKKNDKMQEYMDILRTKIKTMYTRTA